MMEVQHAWDIRIVLDLTLGGMGVAAFILAFLSYIRGERELSLKAALAGIASLLLGLIILVTHLGKPEAAAYTLLSPNFGSVMALGVFFNVLTLIFGGLFALPALVKLPYATNEKVMRVLGLLGAIFSFLVMSYTGVLLARTSIHLWRSPATPLLFIFLAFSSGVGLYVLTAQALKKEVARSILDVGVLATLLALVTFTLYFVIANISTEAFRASIELMLSEYLAGTIALYVLGFIAPLALYAYYVRKPSKALLLSIAALLILQSLIARFLVVYTGVIELPW
ncbi:polysulfide reductase NrfD [Infirmifilum lucidum]|uniref:Polysulfide reductase NrfD n=1 Tax=Infirmifilum lucidum TaxID=2776706 RepID=A0A7L9FGH3_9CREN|nr:NrfD/PsrC family molybdoenzyme membrane anchor subunit [Infirmifilum lucidum]QOJ78859.1 polysulfide reductase NrfD [Infirmifilum lucidum]